MQCSAEQCGAVKCSAIQYIGTMHCQMLVAKICNGGKRVGAGVRSGGGGAGTSLLLEEACAGILLTATDAKRWSLKST